MCDASPDYHGIRIKVLDEQVRVTSFGKDLDAPNQAVILNFVYRNYNKSCIIQIAYCIKMEAAHEFGHALGFQHEQARPDSPAWCDDHSDYISNYYGMDTMIGAWDVLSVMNYCNPLWMGDGDVSPTDIEMVQRFYGKPGGSLYIVTKQRGSTREGVAREVTAYDTLSRESIAISLPGIDDSMLIRDIVASPDGKRVYVLSSDGQHSNLTAINAITSKVAYSATSGSANIKQIDVSPDSTQLYSLTGQGTVSNPIMVELLNSESGKLEGTIAIPPPTTRNLGNSAYFMAKPQAGSDKIYVMTSYYVDAGPESFAIAQLSASEKKVLRQFPIVAGVENPFGATNAAMALAIDGMTMFLPIGSDAVGDLGGFAALDLNTGELKKLTPFSTKTKVKNMQVLDQRRILLGNQAAKRGPTIFDVETGQATEIMSPADLSTSIGYKYVSAANSNVVFSSQSKVINKSKMQENGEYKSEPIEIIADYSSGTMEHIFAFAGAN